MEATIKHQTFAVNGINMHFAEQGEGPVVLLLHGFPQLWYTWRHQISALAALGYRAVAPDLRGFGDSDAPPSPASYTTLSIVGDLVALLDALGAADKVFVVGHDWGAVMAWSLCLYRPDRVKALVNMSVVYNPRNPSRKPVESLRALYGDNYYICRFQEVGEIESDFERIGVRRVLEEFLSYRNPGPLYLPKGKEFDHPSNELPSWLTQQDIDYYASMFNKTGFTGGFNYYRALDLNWELTGPWTGAEIRVPTKFLIGDLDLTYHAPGTKDYIHKGGLKKVVPQLREVVVLEGVAHFLQEERPQEITTHIHEFFEKFVRVV